MTTEEISETMCECGHNQLAHSGPDNLCDGLPPCQCEGFSEVKE